MKILCDREQLLDAFEVVGNVAPVKTPKAILKNVLVRAEADTLTLFATDLEMSAKAAIDAVKIKEPGTVLLPARETVALLRELTDPTLTLESKEFRCTLESGAGSYILVGDDPEQFQPPAVLERGDGIRVRAAKFAEMVRKTGFAAAREETRYAINGLLLDYVDHSLRLVATDGRRLALCYHNLEAGGRDEDVRAVIPSRSLNALSRACPDEGDETLEIHIADNRIGFVLGRVELTSQLLENRFPHYEQVIPKVADTTVDVNRQLLESNLRKVAVLSAGEVRMVKFEFNSSSLRLSAEAAGVGRADLSMDVDVKGAGGTISFNPDYLLDALKASDQEVIRIDMTDESTPAKFSLGEAYTYVLMPISG